MTGPLSKILMPWVAPTVIRNVIPLMKTNIKTQFSITPIEYTVKDFMKSPAYKAIGWSSDVHPEVTASSFTMSGSGVLAVVDELVHAADSIKDDKDSQHGQVHILKFFETQSHAYLFHSPWYDLPNSVGSGAGLLSIGNPNIFRALPYNFPTFRAEIDGLKSLLEPSGFLQSIMGSGPTESEAQAKLRVEKWAGKKIGPFLQLGDSSVVAVERYVEVYDEKTGYIIRIGVMGTTSFHVFDGRLTWMSITDSKTRRTMFSGIGGGRHSIPEMDELNPIGGAVVLSLTIRAYLAGLLAGLKVEDMSPAAYAIEIAKFDKSLGNQRAMLGHLDRQGVALALARQSTGMFVHLDDIS